MVTSTKRPQDQRDFYDKWNQAVHNGRDICIDLINNSNYRPRRIVIPILVVPNGHLWQARYDANGAVVGAVHEVDRMEMLLNCEWKFRPPEVGREYIYFASHLEIVTPRGLRGRLEQLFSFLH